MKNIILVFLLFLNFSYAEINECMSDVYFANGIDTDEDTAKDSLDEIDISTKGTYPETYKSIANWQVSYNHTHGIGIDLYESMLQKIYEDSPGKSFLPFLWNFDEIFGHLNITFKQIVERISKKVPKNAVKEYAAKSAKTIAKDTVQYFNEKYAKNFTEEQIELMFNNIFDHIIEESIGSFIDVTEEEIIAQESADVNTHFLAYNKSIKDGHGVIVIAHSQGNLFTNRVYNEFGIFNNIRKDAWMKEYITAIGVASPANNILGEKTPYMTFENDMIQLIPDSLPAIEPNPHKYYFENAIGEKIETLFSVKAHSFLTSYMEENSTTRGKILEFIDTKVIEHAEERPSQWITDQEFDKNTCDYKITLKHQYEPRIEMAEKVYPFNTSKKLYQVNGEWVKASCGGNNILDQWDGKKDNECLMIDNVEEEKIVKKEEMPPYLSFYLDARVIPTFSGYLVSYDCNPNGGCTNTNLPPFGTCPNAWEQAANRHSVQKQYVDDYISSVISEAVGKYGEDTFTISYSHSESQRTCLNNECNIHTWHCFASQGVHLRKK